MISPRNLPILSGNLRSASPPPKGSSKTPIKSLSSPIAGRSTAAMGQRIDINWTEVFGKSSSPDREADVCFASPSSASAAPRTRARALGAAKVLPGDERRRGSPDRHQRKRLGKLRIDDDWSVGGQRHTAVHGDDGARRPRTRGAAKAADGRVQDAHSVSKDVYDFSPEDEQAERVGNRFCSRLTPIQENKYCQLPLNNLKRQGCAEKRKPISVDKMRKEQLQNSSSVYPRKVQDVVLLDDEDMQPEEEVNCDMSDGQNGPKIYYPSRDNRESVELSRSDIKCLDPGVYLSSPVINFYIQYIKRNRLSSEDFRDKFYIFNTYFYGKLEEALCRQGALELGNHLHSCKREYFRTNHTSSGLPSDASQYLEKEWCQLSSWEDFKNNIHKQSVEVPRQNNEYDCGIFMLYYIERFIKEAPERFTIDKLDMFNRSWFKPEEASGLRRRIRELLLEEFESAKLDDALPGADASERDDSINDGELKPDASSDSSEMVVEVVGGLGGTDKSNEGIKVVASEEASGESGDAGKSTEGTVAASEEKSIEGINVAEPEDACESIGGIYVAESDEASGEFGEIGKTNKGTKVAVSEGASVSGYTDKNMEDISDSEVAVLDKAPTSSYRRGEKTTACVLSEAASLSDSVKDEQGMVKPDSGSSKAEREGDLIVIASPERSEGNDEIIGSMPITDVVCDSCDSDTETKVRIVKIHRRKFVPSCGCSN
ncbi:Ubiquitin-like-specific protease 1D [Zea mays]|uniref:Ubiquitin-like-specific protease 1D n=1 Tax=Zea mays TaxID=4577 RepID=A0A1D6QTL1_MAIZE|nr:Ubiquitin-like-specific protease 1D [Zea mays]